MNTSAERTPPWQRSAGLLSWPWHWQRPARTEAWVHEQLRAGNPAWPLAELVCFPWASLIDLLDRGHPERTRPFTEALAMAPPPARLIRATVCQHIRAERLLPWLQTLGITDLFWSHARTDQPVMEGIRVHAFPLYAVRALDRPAPPLSAPSRPAAQRRHLYSFIGAYAPEGYLTPSRQWIFDLPRRDDALVLRRDHWHYESTVYGEQVEGKPTSDAVRARLEQEGRAFDEILLESTFSLCPSGSGPNSIRLWESLGFGAIPVILADSLRLPGEPAAWDEAVVRVAETRDAVSSLPDRLAAIAADPGRLRRMQAAGRGLWLRYGDQGPRTVLASLGDTAWIRARLAESVTDRPEA